MAVVSLMTAAAIGDVAAAGSPAYWSAAITLAFLSGAMLLAMGVLRLGFLANFLSHPVISGFISASGLLIAASQLKTLMGVKASGHNLIDLLGSLVRQVPNTHLTTLAVGVAADGLPVLGAQRAQALAGALGRSGQGGRTRRQGRARWRRSRRPPC